LGAKIGAAVVGTFGAIGIVAWGFVTAFNCYRDVIKGIGYGLFGTALFFTPLLLWG
jgi:hypothetical protein